MNRLVRAALIVGVAALIPVALAAATPPGSDTKVTVASPPSPFSQNKQNEPAVAVNPIDPTIAAAGVNEEVDMEACNNRADNTCPFTQGVGVSGVYFSDTSGSSWQQPTYTGWTARDCLGVPVQTRQPGRQLRSARRPHRDAAALLRKRSRLRRRPRGRRSARSVVPTAASRGRTAGGSITRTSPSNFSAQRSEPGSRASRRSRSRGSDSQNYAAAKAATTTPGWRL